MYHMEMNEIMSLLTCLCIVLMFVKFQFVVDGPGMSFVGGIICPQASHTCCDEQSDFFSEQNHF